MDYANMREGVFLRRPNRFVAEIVVDGQMQRCHVKNTGRCQELLLPGRRVYVQRRDGPGRKTPYDLICVEKGGKLFNLDSQAPNRVAEEFLLAGGLLPAPVELRREYPDGGSRLDFFIQSGGRRALVEVKGVTLEQGGLALFPDAPTERGLKHARHLTMRAAQGWETCLLFVLQFEDAAAFAPNRKAQPAFAQALADARAAGVRLLAYTCAVSPARLTLKAPVPVLL